MLRRRFAWAGRPIAVLSVAFGLGACAVGTLSTDRASVAPSDQLHQSFLAEAAMISKSAWDEVRSSGSRLGAWMTILMEGRDKSDPTALAASSEAKSPAASYLASKAEAGATPQQQLVAVVADVNDKTAQVDTFIRFADELAADYRDGVTAPGSVFAPSRDDRKQMLDSDRRVVEHAIAELERQKTTYEAVERQLKDARPDLDISLLTHALTALDRRIAHLTVLAQSMGASPVA